MPGLFTCYLGWLAHFSTKYVVFIVKYYSLKKYYKFLESSCVCCPSKHGYEQIFSGSCKSMQRGQAADPFKKTLQPMLQQM